MSLALRWRLLSTLPAPPPPRLRRDLAEALRAKAGARLCLAATCLLMPLAAHPQSMIAGVVRDASGAVLPGVTVEASSPVLIEKVRTAVSDGTGQYRIAELRPGTYGLSFTLTGFATVKRDGVEVSGAGAVI